VCSPSVLFLFSISPGKRGGARGAHENVPAVPVYVSRSLCTGPLTGRARRDDIIFVVFLTTHVFAFVANKKPKKK